MNNLKLILGIGALALPVASGYCLSAANWQYDGEFVTSNTLASANAPMFMDINSQNELAFALLPSNSVLGTGNSQLWVVSGILNPAVASNIAVTQVNIPNLIANEATRGITGVAFKSDDSLFVCGDGGGTNRQIQAFTRTGALAYTSNAPVSVTANQGRVHGLAFSPANPNLLVAGELVAARKLHVYTVSGPTSLSEIGTGFTVPAVGSGLHVRDLAIDPSENIYINSNGTIFKLSGGTLSTSGGHAGYTVTSALFSPGLDNNVNGTGVTWTNLTDEKAAIGVRGNNPSAQPRYNGVYNTDTLTSISQLSDTYLTERIKPLGSPSGNDLTSTSTMGDAKVILGPGSVPYLFMSDIAGGRILRFKSVVPPSAVKEWEIYN